MPKLSLTILALCVPLVSGCGYQRARLAEESARAAEAEARDRAQLAVQEISQLRRENADLRDEIARVKAETETPQSREDSSTMDVTQLADASNRFALELYSQLRAREGNLFFSPSSIYTALAMAYAGAANQTEREMATTLHFPTQPPRLHDEMNGLQAFWKSSDKKQGFRLNLANRLWGQDGFEFLPQFLNLTRTKYGAELARLDFELNPEAARRSINQWVEIQTENMIRDLIPSVNAITGARLVLTNAVYFKGDWTEPFDTKRTKEEEFHLSKSDKVKTPIMNAHDSFRYGGPEGLQVLELPYGDGSLSMFVLLPTIIDGLADLEAKLDLKNLKSWTASVWHQEVVVALPKFKTSSQFEMSGTLGAMGMESAFDRATADFSGMTGGKDLFLSQVIHQAVVDVNEEGTEAAAATAIVAPTAAPVREPKKPPVFRADHPFVFFVRDNRSGAILFIGRVVNPVASGGPVQ